MKRYLSLFGIAVGLLPAYADVPFYDPADPLELGLAETVTVPLPVSAAPITGSFAQLPLSFVRNDGQAGARTKFEVRGQGYLLSLEQTEIEMVLPGMATEHAERLGVRRPSRPSAAFDEDFNHERGEFVESPQPTDGNGLAISSHHPKAPQGWRTPKPGGDAATEWHSLRVKLVGTQQNVVITGEDELPGKFNYFIGNDPALWRTNVPSFAKVRYQEIYSGIDLVYYGKEGQLEYDFVVKPGADLSQIAMAIEGADAVEVNSGGDLRLEVAGRELFWRKPVLFQEVDGVRVPVAGGYALLPAAAGQDTGTTRYVAFQVAPYNRALALVIDPVLAYSTYLGGAWWERPEDIVVDAAGCLYVVGGGNSGDGSGALFPTTTNSILRTGGGAFVTKFNPGGNKLLYSTLLCGLWQGNAGAWASGIALDAAGQAVIVGGTMSPDFPTKNAIQAYYGGGFCDAFVAKLNTNGSALVFSTFLGGSDLETGIEGSPDTKVQLDAADNIYVVGGTKSPDFPTANALQELPGGGTDLFITKLDSNGSNLIYSTYLGGSANEWPSGFKVDPAGNAYVVGSVGSAGADTYYRFVKLAPSGTSLEQSITITSLTNAYITAIEVDRNGALYVAGSCWGELPNTPTAFQPARAGDYDGFVGKLNHDGTAWEYLTYLGGTFGDGANAIFVDRDGNAFVAGSTSSTNFPVRNAFQERNLGTCLQDCDYLGGNAFVCKLNAAGSDIVWSTYLGGSNVNPFWPQADEARGITVDAAGGIYVAGSTVSPNFPTLTPYQRFRNSSNPSVLPQDVFVTKFIDPPPKIQITRAGNTVRIAWPVLAAGFNLESSASIGSAANWTVEPSPALVVGDQSVVTVEIGEGSKFFRLKKQ